MSNVEDCCSKAYAQCKSLEGFFAFKMGCQKILQQYHDRFIALNCMLVTIDHAIGNTGIFGMNFENN